MGSSPLLQLQHVSRVLTGRRVVDDVNFRLERGAVLGLLGINGAGKSTTLRLIAGVLAPSSGQIHIDGNDLHENPHALRGLLGYLPERAPLYSELRVREYLHFCARLHGVARQRVTAAVDSVLARCDLGTVCRRLIGQLSKGQQQRVGIAAALVHAPALIVLDEPASGLDPLQAVQIRTLIRELGRDHAVILSTHLLPDVQACCDRVVILHHGRVRHDEVARFDGSADTIHVALEQPIDAAQWQEVTPAAVVRVEGTAWRVELQAGASAADLAAAVVARGWRLRELRPATRDLEQLFLRIVGASDERAAA